MNQKKILGVYDYTVVLTYLGMASAFVGVLFSINEHYTQAILCLMIAGICDMFDGAVAGTKKTRTADEKHFGIQIDSMCDLISFGVLPALFVYMFEGKTRIAGIISGIFVLCALIRLSFFNVQEFERQKVEAGHRTSYLGMPVTSVALFLPLVYLIDKKIAYNCWIIYMILIALLSLGFVAGFQIKKPQKVGKIILIIIGIAELVGICLLAKAGVA